MAPRPLERQSVDAPEVPGTAHLTTGPAYEGGMAYHMQTPSAVRVELYKQLGAVPHQWGHLQNPIQHNPLGTTISHIMAQTGIPTQFLTNMVPHSHTTDNPSTIVAIITPMGTLTLMGTIASPTLLHHHIQATHSPTLFLHNIQATHSPTLLNHNIQATHNPTLLLFYRSIQAILSLLFHHIQAMRLVTNLCHTQRSLLYLRVQAFQVIQTMCIQILRKSVSLFQLYG
jgi:hypothetical protein